MFFQVFTIVDVEYQTFVKKKQKSPLYHYTTYIFTPKFFLVKFVKLFTESSWAWVCLVKSCFLTFYSFYRTILFD